MVEQLSIVFMYISIGLSIGVPVGLIGYLLSGKKTSWAAVAAGILIFMVAHIILRIPLQMKLEEMTWYQTMMANPMWYALFLGLSIGLFEEAGRYIGLYLLKNRRSFWDAVGIGLGYGSVEALIIGMQVINNVTIAKAINNGSIYDIYSAADPKLVAQMVETMANTSSYMYLLSGIERICFLAIEVALTLYIMKAIRNKDFKPVLIAFGLHLLIDSLLTPLMKVSPLLMEAYIIAWAGAAIYYILRLSKEYWPNQAIE